MKRSAPLALLAALLLALLPALGARADAAGGNPTRGEIYRSLGLQHQPADHIVLVDTSPSMAQQGRYETVRQTLRTFLSGLTSADHVALYTFDSTVVPRYIGAADDPAAILARLPAAPPAKGDTDIGAALDAALAELERGDALPVASVVLMTDGENAPPTGTRYPTAGTTAWTAALHERAAKLAGRTDLVGYALPLATGATGAGLLRQVVTDTRELVPGSIQDLGAYLQRAGDDTRLRQARAILAADLGQGVDAAWTGPDTLDLTHGEVAGAITFTSRTGHLPLTVEGLGATVSGGRFRVSGLPTSLALEPGAGTTVPVRIGGGFDDGPLTPRHVAHADAVLHLTGAVGSPWQPALAPDLPLKVPAALLHPDLPVRVSAQVGSAAALPLTVGVPLLVLLLLGLAWRRVHRPPLDGVLLVEPAFGGRIPERIALSGRRVRLRPAVGGSGLVRGRRRRTGLGSRIDLRIRYTPDGDPARAGTVTCAPDGRVVVAGTAFLYRRNGSQGPTAVTEPAGWRP
ncbi:VWA domain-containing protein [Kitasatospora sp. NPDC101176]|uniref:VWA domain-containing protein n=1 Tax=Kitasatospora sp. NPDC101176 TaxID=3364099 RepID=UPI003805E18D